MNVFIDTSIFVKYHFIFDKYKLKKLSELAEAGLIRLITTEIVKHEIIKNLKEETGKSRKAINAVFEDGKFLQTFSQYQAIEEFFKSLKADIEKMAVEKFNLFLEKTNTQIIGYDKVDPSIIFTQYFSSAAPFGVKNKKHEFPDAFTLQALINWGEENDETIYVVGGDKDLENACKDQKHLVYVDDIPKLLEIYTEEMAETFVIENAYKIFKETYSNIIEKILSDIPLQEIQSSEWYELGDDITEVEVVDHEVIVEELTSASEAHAEFELLLKVGMKATHNMKNPHSAIYSGEGDPWYTEGVTFTQTHENEISVTVSLDFADEKDGLPPEINVVIDESYIELETDFDADDVEVTDNWSLMD